MKTKFAVLLTLILAFTLIDFSALAQTSSDTLAPAVDPSVVATVTAFITGFVVKYPWLSTVIFIIGALRILLKPIMSLIETYVQRNCSASEFAALQHFEQGPIYKWLSWGIDLVGSIKLPVVKKSQEIVNQQLQ